MEVGVTLPATSVHIGERSLQAAKNKHNRKMLIKVFSCLQLVTCIARQSLAIRET